MASSASAIPVPPISALSTSISEAPASFPFPTYHHNLALTIKHNLRYQHDWSDVQIHTHSFTDPNALLPRPMISGRPPQRVYIHPDEQVELLAREKLRNERNTERKDSGSASGEELNEEGQIEDGIEETEREWVLPTHLLEKWSLRQFAEVFDAITIDPPEFIAHKDGLQRSSNSVPQKTSARARRGVKMLLLATAGDDSTVVYYVVHDGIVKPRQN